MHHDLSCYFTSMYQYIVSCCHMNSQLMCNMTYAINLSCTLKGLTHRKYKASILIHSQITVNCNHKTCIMADNCSVVFKLVRYDIYRNLLSDTHHTN